MGEQKSARYYDQIYRKRDQEGVYQADPRHTEFYGELWSKVAKLVPSGRTVIDIGCGPGEFAAVFRDMRSEQYVGYDFSQAATSVAKKRNLPQCDFFVTSAENVNFHKLNSPCFICLEMLEHIEDDKKLLKKIGAKSTLIFSVPTFDSPGHVRWFDTVSKVIERYGPILPHVKHVHSINVRNGHKIFIFASNVYAAPVPV